MDNGSMDCLLLRKFFVMFSGVSETYGLQKKLFLTNKRLNCFNSVHLLLSSKPYLRWSDSFPTN